jgi:hypothetical protein
MRRLLGLAVLIGYSAVVGTQPAEFEVQRSLIFECAPTFSAIGDQLVLYRQPDLRSETITIPYRAGWRVPAPTSEMLARVLRIGRLRVVEPDAQMRCSVPEGNDPPELAPGDIVEYLHRRGEGRGQIRVSGIECTVRAYEDFGLFQLLQEPEVQRWLRVFYADGTSPGWLLNDGSQTYLSCRG